jgi:hypothetical protein
MRSSGSAGGSVLLASFVLAATLPAAASPSPSPLSRLQYLTGSWTCTYRAGAVSMAYDATYAYDRGGNILREIASWAAGGGDEELIGYDAHAGWTAVVVDDHGSSTVMRAAGSDPKHIVYRSTYPDTSLAVTYDRVSSTEYTLHATYRAGGKTITSVDTCLRAAR